MERVFCGKLLLFGEYSILMGSNALAIPFCAKKAILQPAISNSTEADSNQQLKQFADFLEDKFPTDFNHQKLNYDLQKGLNLKSDIPQGYGAGSSGSVVAAIFSQYGVNKEFTLTVFKSLFSSIESFFHGKSSGLDVLVSYFSVPILVKPNSVEIIEFTPGAESSLYLADSKAISRTSDMIAKFNAFSTVKKEVIGEKLIPLVNVIIERTISNEPVLNEIKALSIFTLEHLSFAIPNQWSGIWQHGIDTDEYYMKLCGSGGGGYIQVHTRKDSIPAIKGIDLLKVY